MEKHRFQVQSFRFEVGLPNASRDQDLKPETWNLNSETQILSIAVNSILVHSREVRFSIYPR
jgi:hypothetical protein